LGVSRQGEFENTRKKMSTFQNNYRGNIFSGAVFCWVIFLTPFPFDLFCCVG
jgi:hypothetical protein